MINYDVAIIGGGAAGISCAITLSSVEEKFSWAKEKKYILFDDGDSDILRAKFYNVAGVTFGIEGEKLLSEIKDQLNKFRSTTQIEESIIKIEGEKGNFSIHSKNSSYLAKTVVLATGMHHFNIEMDGIEVLPHNKIMKPNKIKLNHDELKIKDGVFVAGLASGNKSMYAIACGEGTRVACDIFEEWTGKFTVAHDSMKN